ncbi:MAG: hypothetical protein CMQ40_10320 [Gammaproteobacteria bacterium]|nr:hypothetical protein [Gammaproteobacteria bacterium]|tara:strand:- start:20 stop:355 length:336 start_codon:yes stop_codon:yes gene_type:complete
MKKKTTSYSTELGNLCFKCKKSLSDCVCFKDDVVKTSAIRVERQTKGRKGNPITIISGIPLDKAQIKTLAKELKQKLGVGGTVSNTEIIIQGDNRNLIVKILEEKGLKVTA